MSSNNSVEIEKLEDVSGGAGKVRVIAHAVCANCGANVKDFFTEAEINAWRNQSHTCNTCHSVRYEIRYV